MSLPTVQPDEGWIRRVVLAGILVGGASTRMRQPKLHVRYEGATFLERVLAALEGRVGRVVLLGNDPVPAAPPLARLADARDTSGPLAGILAALRWQPQACWLIVACDLPLLRGEAIDWLLGQRGPDRAAVLPRAADERVEPLLAIYEPQSLPLLEGLVARGLSAPHRLAGEPGVYTPTPPTVLQPCWTNVNTPEQLRRLSRIVAEQPPC